jgi:starch synthase
LAHRIEAGSDFFLMPSRFEPCGLNQMYSLRYGSIPIVRNVGGLSDSVVGLDENPTQADGIKFSDFGVSALMQALAQALELYQDQKQLKAMQKRGMARDFSWQATSNAYLELYRQMVS